MKDLDKALAEITAIRVQMARGAEFRGYGPATLAGTAGLAGLAAAAQSIWLQQPLAEIASYLALWVSVAALSASLVAVETVLRSRRIHSGLADEMIWAAVEQFMPAAAAGALLTIVLFRYAPEALWMLPGLWQILFSLATFASARFLPRPIFAVGIWYLACGLACLAFGNGPAALSPWAMGVPFGIGQLLAAGVLQHRAWHDHG